MAKSDKPITRNGVRVRVNSRGKLEADFRIRVAGKIIRWRRDSPYQESRQKTFAWAEGEREAIRKNGGHTKAEAPRIDPTEPRPLRFWASRWLEDAQNPARKHGRNRGSTVTMKEQSTRLHLIPGLGQRPITRIDEDAVAGYVKRKLEDGYAELTIATHLSYLRSIILLARRKGSGAEREAQIPENIKLKKPKRKKAEVTLSEVQTRKALAAAKLRSRDMYALACLLFRQGCRIGEALALRWSAVHERGISIIESWHRKEGFGPTKGGEPRALPMHPETAEALAAIKPANGEPWQLVFTSPRDDQKPYYGLIKRLTETIDRLELRDEAGKLIHFTTHVGRHSFGRHWAERGLPFRGLQEVLGHTSIVITQIYMRWAPSENAQHIAKIGTERQPDMDAVTAKLKALGVGDEVLVKAGLQPRTVRPAKRAAKKRRRA